MDDVHDTEIYALFLMDKLMGLVCGNRNIKQNFREHQK